ncbi:MAG: tRNA lysidine(34) synthetase TilS [Hyphomicrobiaceae bacterium]|nr:tRNA lysidine(34) synthetase TilS [Hyphomicrobiaceae bacterium]
MPFTSTELAALFAPVSAYASVALAVSGGGDSTALMHLYAHWSASAASTAHPPPPQPLVLTVDHQLRPSSAAEAARVADDALKLGWPHETLIWQGEKPASGLQDAARNARYRLIAERLRQGPTPAALLTAHTLCDQAETVLMRLARGSGTQGLAGMAPIRPLSREAKIDLVRPLLSVPGSRLREWLTAQGVTWIEDPTNRNLDHERPRLRAVRNQLDALGLNGAAIARSANRLRRAEEAIRWATWKLGQNIVKETPGVIASVAAADFTAAPAELRIRLLALLLSRYGGSHPRATLAEIERLNASIESAGPTGASKQTLGGSVIANRDGQIVIYRELGREPLPEIRLTPGETAIWDNRFKVALATDAPGPETVAALSDAQWRDIRSIVAARWPDGVATTAPTALFTAALLSAGAKQAMYSAEGIPAIRSNGSG